MKTFSLDSPSKALFVTRFAPVFSTSLAIIIVNRSFVPGSLNWLAIVNSGSSSSLASHKSWLRLNCFRTLIAS